MAAPAIKIYSGKDELAEKLARDFSEYVKRLTETADQVDIALSGGSTPNLFFRAMTALRPEIDWERVRFYWVDERCVPPDHPESNFGTAYELFLGPLGIPGSSYFRIKGENNPEDEAERYGDLILDQVSPEISYPVFDLIFLGMGSDGHTASIFPHEIDLWNADSLCTVGTHPESGQKRVTFTGHLINAAARVQFLVTGDEKSEIVEKVITRTGNYSDYPASLVAPNRGELVWYMDMTAASLLK
jgi:6-phosphogluconolactonase